MYKGHKLRSDSSRFTVKKLLIFVGVCVLFTLAYKFGQASTVSAADKPVSVSVIDQQIKRQIEESGEKVPEIEVLSWKPRIFVYHNFISDEDCDHIVEIGTEEVIKGGKKNAGGQAAGGYLIQTQKDHVLMSVEKKIADWTMLPEVNGEVFYMSKFEKGQGYGSHVDFFHGDDAKRFIGEQGQRMASVVVFLSTPEGGELIFEDVKVKVAPVKGTAVLYYNLIADGKDEPLSKHEDARVTSGTKYTITKWLRQNAASRPEI
mmetsp:Transcript_5800/g.6297  ORF Transcript_5800/g.6297 Transcript_5800/m.6297 type:complete len:261 (-) Transcript_5800:120-902(-)|eukprot:CAMPEP_0168524970 /NCGR_PEP_ID=MMETSP0405-20121227/11002_1 /TAXON_ID=498012 /ORGANISM="Trichosphaerium sp, Strain Am-I-7 wt" /LENGTH=260 /DNA_ID=CAMNT_0008547349 /DNA_START=30 /DNA_END=812 /DNA_ORIENTATION=+